MTQKLIKNPFDLTDYQFDNTYEIYTLRKDKQPQTIPVPIQPWSDSMKGQNRGGTTTFWTRKICRKIPDLLSVVTTGSYCLTEISSPLDPTWPLAFGVTPIARKRQQSLILQNHGISIIADLFVPEKFAELNLIGIPDGYAAFGTRASAGEIDNAQRTGTRSRLDLRYERACSVARKGHYCLDAPTRQALKDDPSFPTPLLSCFAPLFDQAYSNQRDFADSVNKLYSTHVEFPRNQRDFAKILSKCAHGELKVFLVCGGGNFARDWAIKKNNSLKTPCVWWVPDTSETVPAHRVNSPVIPDRVKS